MEKKFKEKKYDDLIEEVEEIKDNPTYFGIPLKKDDKGMLYHEIYNGEKRHVCPDHLMNELF